VAVGGRRVTRINLRGKSSDPAARLRLIVYFCAAGCRLGTNTCTHQCVWSINPIKRSSSYNYMRERTHAERASAWVLVSEYALRCALLGLTLYLTVDSSQTATEYVCACVIHGHVCALCARRFVRFAFSLLPSRSATADAAPRRYIKNTPRSLGQTPRAAQIMGSLCLFSGWRDARSQIIIHRAPTYVTRAQKVAARRKCRG